jgi:hypothetical protein
MPACSKDAIACSRNWGVRQSLVIATITGSALRQCESLGLSGDGVRMEVIGGDDNSVDVAIEIAAGASLGPRMLIVEYALARLMLPDFFTVVEPTGMPSAGLEMRGIGSHLL